MPEIKDGIGIEKKNVSPMCKKLVVYNQLLGICDRQTIPTVISQCHDSNKKGAYHWV
jgi:hypothetical protein